jgi:hypothetical protein
MITRGNSFKLLVHYIFLEDTKYMTILTRQERERLVLELYYNQGKTYREIAKEARISPRDIGAILNKAVQEKDEGEKEQDKIDCEKNHNQEQQHKKFNCFYCNQYYSSYKEHIEHIRYEHPAKLYYPKPEDFENRL